MKSFEIKALGLEEMSAKEVALVDGGTTIRYYTGDNEFIYAGNALVNGVKYLVHFAKQLLHKEDELTYEFWS